MEFLFKSISISPVYIDAVVGKNLILPHPDFDEKRYRMAHGKRPNLSELGCYFSHLKAMEKFLDDCDDDHALILEDDLQFDSKIELLIKESLKHHEKFDLLMLSGIHHGHPVNIISLNEEYSLACNITQLNGSGAYLLNKYAAQQILKELKPMWLPYDHAFSREWTFGVKTMIINPLPVDQNITSESQINASSNYKLPRLKRTSVLLFRLYTELSRLAYRTIRILKLKFQISTIK